MFKNSESPISLFSFQDIITSLTGIMLTVVLLLALELINSRQKQAEASPLAQEMELARQIRNAAEKRKKELEADIARLQEASMSSFKYDAEILRMNEKALKEELEKIEQALSMAENEQGKLDEKLREQSRRAEMLKEKQRKKAEISARAEKIAKENKLLEEKLGKVNEALDKKRKGVKISFSSGTDKKPVLVECSRTLVRVSVFQSGEVKEFRPESPILTDMAKNVVSYLSTLPPSMYYIVFLAKPSSGAYFHFLQRYSSEKLKHSIGEEPIYEEEDCL
ncbi:MAG: hypothetical protein IKS20_10015 [Victivallales bacterium]|nr:hypothetical protein [Victivallales bacterium]